MILPPRPGVTTLGEQHCTRCLLSQASQDAFADPRAEHLSLSPGCVCSGLWGLLGDPRAGLCGPTFPFAGCSAPPTGLLSPGPTPHPVPHLTWPLPFRSSAFTSTGHSESSRGPASQVPAPGVPSCPSFHPHSQLLSPLTLPAPPSSSRCWPSRPSCPGSVHGRAWVAPIAALGWEDCLHKGLPSCQGF